MELPVAFVALEASLPNQTPVTRSAVYPTNHASRDCWVVPVLPAAGRPMFAARALPYSTVSCIIAFIMPMISGLATRVMRGRSCWYSTLPDDVVMRCTK